MSLFPDMTDNVFGGTLNLVLSICLLVSGSPVILLPVYFHTVRDFNFR